MNDLQRQVSTTPHPSLPQEDPMGRTVPTFTMVLQQEMDSWSKFRRGLRREDQEALDELFRTCLLYTSPSPRD